MLMGEIGDIVLEPPHHECVPHNSVSNITSSHNQPFPRTHQLTSKAPNHTENDADTCFGNKSWSRELFVAVVDEMMCAASG